ncbi:MAG TPA: Sua5/YciO/YrdC/YwlC family protein, partial [Streptosporangiaceae bacterium]|nr:Sua5/YciO/YrdC/YwlC family protein [Streptosporangiaceae bacterium]
LTLVMRANRNLIWDLGDTKGTVAVRMPLHELTLELLKQTGPLAVSSANRSGAPPATTAADAEAQLGEAVAVYLDDGPCSGDVPSTIVDLTGAVPKLLRRGVISIARLREVVTLAVDDEWMEDDIGAVADGTMTDGTMTDGTADGAEAHDTVTDGTAADGAAADGTVADGTAADGTAADGTAADGTAPGGRAAGGASAGGAAADGTVAE